MELHQLEYFVAVAEEASFTRAAARLYVSQPGVSAQVRRLELELGQALLDRSGRRVRLTEVGAAVLPHARAALQAVAGARLAVDELTGLMRGHVAVGMVNSSSSFHLPDLLAGFHSDHPAVEITLSAATSDSLLEALQDGRLDMALVGLAIAPPPGIETQVIVDEPVVAAVGHGDSLAGRTTMALDAIRERALISLPRGTGTRTCLDDACAAAGFQPRVAFEASDPLIAAQLASRGLGVAILPESAASALPSELHSIAFTRPPLRSRIELAWRAGGPSSPAARALIDRARTALVDATAAGARAHPPPGRSSSATDSMW
jgi:DNA-binding transcriptional LysR family regulator